MSLFDPESFMSAPVEGALDTHSEPIPEGVFAAIIDDLKVREAKGRDGNPVYPLDVIFEITDDTVKTQLGRDKVTCRMSIWLDVTSQGQLDMGKGKNVGLGKLRDAVGQNNPGQLWQMPMLKGAGPVAVRIKHTPNKDDPSAPPFANVVSVAKYQ
jgi:hypothetical protein